MTYIVLKAPLNSNQPTNQPRDMTYIVLKVPLNSNQPSTLNSFDYKI